MRCPCELPERRGLSEPLRKFRPKLVPLELPDHDEATEGVWGSGRCPQWASPVGFPDLVIIPAILIASGALGVFEVSLRDDSSQRIKHPPQSSVAPATEHTAPRDVVKQFLSPESSLQDRMALLREPFDPDQVRKHFESHQPDLESGIDTGKYLGHNQMLEISYHLFEAKFGSGDVRYLYVVEEGEELKIDWDAYSRTGTSSWENLLTGVSGDAEMPVFLRPSAYYNHGFSDKISYSAYVAFSPDLDRDVFLYVQRQSTTESALDRAVGSSPGPVPVRVRIKDVDGSHQHWQFLCTHVVASAWVKSEITTMESLWGSSDPAETARLCEHARRAGALSEALLMYEHGSSLHGDDPDVASRYFSNAAEYVASSLEGSRDASLALATALVQKGDAAAAERELEKVLKLEPDAEAYFLMGNCEHLRGNVDKAQHWLERVLRLNPDHLQALNNLAWILATNVDSDHQAKQNAVRLAQRAVQLTSEQETSFLDTLAVALSAAGRSEDAISVTEKALAKNSGNDLTHQNRLTGRLDALQQNAPRATK